MVIAGQPKHSSFGCLTSFKFCMPIINSLHTMKSIAISELNDYNGCVIDNKKINLI